MRQVIGRVQEGLFRLLGMLSAVSYFLHHFRVGVPMSWIVLALLALGTFGSARAAIHRLVVYQSPLWPIYELEKAPLESYYRVRGLAFKDSGYQFYRDSQQFAGYHREILENYYLLLDPDSGWGVLVGTHERLFEADGGRPVEPVPAVVTGKLVEIHAALREGIEANEWSASGVVLVNKVLEAEESRLPLREMVALFLLVVGTGTLLLTHWFNYVLFWPSPEGLDHPGRWDVDPLETVFRLSASLPLVGSLRRVRMVEWAARIQPAEEGSVAITMGEEKQHSQRILLSAASIEAIVHGWVFFGLAPHCALEVIYRDRKRIRRRLSMSFDFLAQRRAVYALLTSEPAPGSCGGVSASSPE